VTATAQFATSGDVRIAYETRGAGDPLLLVHGLGYTREGWGPALDLLADEFLVVAFDNRGIGQSDVPPGPYTSAAMAEDALAVLDANGIARAHVVGTSLGGMVAQELALAHPERIRRLVLVATTPGGAGAYALPARTLTLLRTMPTLPPHEALRLAVENALADDVVRARPDLVEEIYEHRLAHPFDVAGWQAQSAAGSSFDAYDRIGEIVAPTLVLHGTCDNVVDHLSSEAFAARIPNARVELVGGGGHLFFWEDPDGFVARVVAFLREDA
jgi:3-oxoadipate enol-lactonase